MSEPSEIRVVRCPKCENLLPELNDYSVYQCGGCGAVLRGKTGILEANTLSVMSDEERVHGDSDIFPEKLKNYSFPEGMNQSDGSENNTKSNISYSGTSHKRVLFGNTADNHRNGPSTKIYESGVGVADTLEVLKPPNVISNGSRKSAGVADWRSVEGGEFDMFRRNPTRDFHGVRYSTSIYSEDGPSNYNLRSSYAYGEAMNNNQKKADEFRKVGYLDQDRAELLRKLDEIKDQLSRSCDVKDKPKEKFPIDRRWIHNEEPYGGLEFQLPDGSWGSNGRLHYGRHYPEPSPYVTTQEMEMHNLHPSVHAPIQVQRFGDPLRSQGHRRGPHQPHGALQRLPSHPYIPGQYTDSDVDSLESYPPITNFHHPSCSCFHCYSQQVPVPVAPSAFHNRMFANAQNSLMFHHHETPSAFGPRDYNHKVGRPPPLNNNNLQSLARWPSVHNSEVAGFDHHRPAKVVLATHGQRCRPIAGGAPFVTCYNCLELLQLPKKILLVDKNEKKVRCGGCSTVILISIIDKKLVSVCTESDRNPKLVDDSPNATVNGTSYSHGHAKLAGTTFSSDDYDDSGYNFEVMDREVISSSIGKHLSSNKPGEIGRIHSTSPYSSDDEGKINSVFAKVEESNCVELVAESNLSPPVAGSPLQYHIEYSNRFRLGDRFRKGSQRGNSGSGKVEEPNKVSSLPKSMEDGSLATEIDVSANEYSNTGTSQESEDISREDQVRANKGNQSFFGDISEGSFKDSSKSNLIMDQSSTHVTINGHVISDGLLKKAEKLSGPIHPGHYWYDSRAGFWGVMGGPCLGIIPPFIEEFDYPMPEDCSGGNTGVFVNGRELHQKDLNLLSTRGLPTTRDRSYIVEISGRVLDGDSGEELDRLGKLAPTIEKVKHGFGMKVPRVAA